MEGERFQHKGTYENSRRRISTVVGKAVEKKNAQSSWPAGKMMDARQFRVKWRERQNNVLHYTYVILFFFIFCDVNSNKNYLINKKKQRR